MSFIRAKEIPPHSGNWYDYEVESIWNHGKPRQKHIRYIGRSTTHGLSSGMSGGSLHSIPMNVAPTSTLPIADDTRMTKMKTPARQIALRHMKHGKNSVGSA